MGVTYATDAEVFLTSTLARAALVAYSDLQVAGGGSTVTSLDSFREEAKRQILSRLRQQGWAEADLTRTTDLKTVEVALTLALLFEALQQWSSDGRQDIYAKQGEFWRARYKEELTTCAPVDGLRRSAGSFEWDRG